MSDPDNLLRAAAEALPGPTGDTLRARLAQHAAADLIQDIHLAHARCRESVVNGTRHALRCGALLLDAGGDWGPLLRATGMSEEAAAGYVALAIAYPELAETASRRFGRIGEVQALTALRCGALGPPVGDLRTLAGLRQA